MGELKFDLEWHEVNGSRGMELAATWARLAIRIDGTTVTEAYDLRAQSVRQSVLVPLYPLAEWLASHWWGLLYEAETPGRDGYDLRHNLRFGREGFALPNLLINPTGARALLEWHPFHLPEAQISFTGNGTRVVPLRSIQEALAALIDTVLDRLDQQGVTDSYLHQEWQTIQGTDEDEAAFCIAAAQLGQDPYSLDEQVADSIVAAAGKLPAQWQEDFFSVADSLQLEAQTRLVERARERARKARDQFAAICRLRTHTEKIDSRGAPWEQGYELARALREHLGLDAAPLSTDEALANAFAIPSLAGLGLEDLAASKLFDAMVDCEDGGSPAFLTTKHRTEQIRFAFCRALFEYLSSADSPSALVTVARTDRQKRNRAFAAEFLAPASWLRQRISGNWVGQDEVDDWAYALGVSTRVIEHQIENHSLARLAGL